MKLSLLVLLGTNALAANVTEVQYDDLADQRAKTDFGDKVSASMKISFIIFSSH